MIAGNDARAWAGGSRAFVIGAIVAALFVSALSQTVVATALPRMIGDLGGLSFYSWVLTASMLSMTATMPLVGKLSDIYGRKPFLMGGIILFMVASAVTGASQDMVQLIACRAVQGIGAGTIQASAFAAIGDLFAPHERGRFFGLFTGVFAVASVAGPLLGGVVTDQWGWRWVFYVTIPFGFLALAVLAKGMPWERDGRPNASLDWLGMAALLWAVLPLLLAFAWAGDRFAWVSWPIASLLAACMAGTAAFTLIERRAKDPVLPLWLFRERVFVVVSAASVLTGIGLFGALSYMPLFIQGALGASATNSGLVNSPMMLGLTVASLAAGHVAASSGAYRQTVVAGGAVLVGGMAIMAMLDERASLALPIAAMIIMGIGLGLSLPLLGLAVQNSLSARLLGVATASTQFFRQIGGTLGIAVFGSVLTAGIHDDLVGRLPPELRDVAPDETLRQLEQPRILLSPQAMAQMRDGFASFGDSGPGLYDQTIAAMRSVLADGLHDVFVIGLVVAVLAMVASTFLPQIRIAAPEPRRRVAFEDWGWLAEGRVLQDVLVTGDGRVYGGNPAPEEWYDDVMPLATGLPM